MKAHSTPQPAFQNKALVGSLCALLATLIWSGNFVVARGLGDIIPPFTLATSRWSTATIFILPFAAASIWRERALLKTHIKHLVISALIGVTTFNTFIYTAAHTTDTLNLSLIATTTPAFVVLLSRFWLGEPITRAKLIGLIAAISGIVILVTRGQLDVLLTLDFHIGDIWMLTAALLWAFYSIHLKRRPAEISQLAYLGSTFTMGTLPLIPLSLIELAPLPPLNLTLPTISSILYIGIGASIISYFLWSKAVTTIGPTKSSFIYYCLPAFCGIEAYLILGEAITFAHGIGFILILSGILIATPPRFNR